MEIIADEEIDNVRVDRFLRKKYPNNSLSELFKGIRTGKIKINNKKVKENQRIQKGDIIRLYFGEMLEKEYDFIELQEKERAMIKKSIIFENDDIFLFNKKKNIVMHKGTGHDHGLVEMMKTFYKNKDIVFVNRIDKDTCGLVIGCKKLSAARDLAADIRDHKITKKYFILVAGNIDKENFVLKSYLKKIDEKVIETSQDQEGAKESVSSFSVIKAMHDKTLLEGELHSGRTHQLRVQLAKIGHYILGDKKYGKKDRYDTLFLFSHYIKIPRYDVELDLPLPYLFEKEI